MVFKVAKMSIRGLVRPHVKGKYNISQSNKKNIYIYKNLFFFKIEEYE